MSRDVVVVRGGTMSNAANLPEQMLRKLQDRYAGTRRGLQELEGLVLDEVAGALWTREVLDESRIRPPARPPAFQRIVVAIDPMVTDIAVKTEAAGIDKRVMKAGGSETGIIVAALGVDGHGYVLEDASLSASPLTWANRSIAMMEKWRADRLVGEQNNGGALVEVTLRSISPHVPYKSVIAARGKITRAEPVAALYEQGKVHHCALFNQLEDQLVSYIGDPGEKSPDRLDALVWALTELMLVTTPVPMVAPISVDGSNYWSGAQDG